MAGEEAGFCLAGRNDAHLIRLQLSRHPAGLHQFLLEHFQLFNIHNELAACNFSSAFHVGGKIFCSPMHYIQAIEMAQKVCTVGVRDIVVDARLMGTVVSHLRYARIGTSSHGQVFINSSTYLGVAKGDETQPSRVVVSTCLGLANEHVTYRKWMETVSPFTYRIWLEPDPDPQPLFQTFSNPDLLAAFSEIEPPKPSAAFSAEKIKIKYVTSEGKMSKSLPKLKLSQPPQPPQLPQPQQPPQPPEESDEDTFSPRQWARAVLKHEYSCIGSLVQHL